MAGCCQVGRERQAHTEEAEAECPRSGSGDDMGARQLGIREHQEDAKSRAGTAASRRFFHPQLNEVVGRIGQQALSLALKRQDTNVTCRATSSSERNVVENGLATRVQQTGPSQRTMSAGTVVPEVKILSSSVASREPRVECTQCKFKHVPATCQRYLRKNT